MDLAEIKKRWRLSARCTAELEPLFADDAFNWLIAEVERLTCELVESQTASAMNATSAGILAECVKKLETERDTYKTALITCWNDFGYFENGGVSQDTVAEVQKTLGL